MEKEMKTIIGTALLFTIITCIPSLINRLGQAALLKFTVKVFLVRNLLWFVSVAGIIAFLIFLGKKLSSNFLSETKENSIVLLSTGILAVIDGVINIAGSLPIYILSIQSSIQTYHLLKKEQYNLIGNIVVDVVSIIALLCQLFLGIYLINHSRRDIDIKAH